MQVYGRAESGGVCWGAGCRRQTHSSPTGLEPPDVLCLGFCWFFCSKVGAGREQPPSTSQSEDVEVPSFGSGASSTFCVVGVSSRSWPERCCDVWGGWARRGCGWGLRPEWLRRVVSPGEVLSGAEGCGGVVSAGSKSVSTKRKVAGGPVPSGSRHLRRLMAHEESSGLRTSESPASNGQEFSETFGPPPQTQDTSVELHAQRRLGARSCSVAGRVRFGLLA